MLTPTLNKDVTYGKWGEMTERMATAKAELVAALAERDEAFRVWYRAAERADELHRLFGKAQSRVYAIEEAILRAARGGKP